MIDLSNPTALRLEAERRQTLRAKGLPLHEPIASNEPVSEADGMPRDVREAIGDELNITLAGFAHRAASPAHLLTAYAEHLGGFSIPDIRAGFRRARLHAETFAPSAAA